MWDSDRPVAVAYFPDPMLPLELLLEPPPLREVAHAARRLGLSHEGVRRLLRKGDLKGIRFGRRWKIDPVVLEAYIDAHRVDAPTRPPLVMAAQTEARP